MIDTHSHLFVEEFAEDLPEVICRAKEAGVTHVFMPNIDDTTTDDMLRVCRQYPDYCYPMLGFHPTSVDASSLDKVLLMKASHCNQDKEDKGPCSACKTFPDVEQCQLD